MTHDSRLTIIWYLLSLLAAILAMKTKENAFTLPVVIALYEFLFFSGPLKPRIIRLLPFLFTMLIIPVTIMGTGSTAGEIISQVKDPASLGYLTPDPKDYFITQFRVIITYIRLLFIPVDQNLGYDYPVYRTFFTAPVFFSFLFLAAIFGGAVYLIYKTQGKKSVVSSKKDKAENSGPGTDDFSLLTTHCSLLTASRFTFHFSRLLGFGILWFFITLSVESSIIPIPMLINEYRVYLPSVGFFLALVSGVALLLTRFTKKVPSPLPSPSNGEGHLQYTKITAVLFGVIILTLASATYARNILWKDRVILWEDVVRKSPNLTTARVNMGIAYKDAGMTEKAIEQYRIAARLRPDFPMAHMNLGNALDILGQLDEAIEEYQIALQLQPDNWRVRLNLGNAYGKKGLSDKAIEELQLALKLNPNSWAAFNNMGNVYLDKGETEKAIGYYLDALKLKPDYPEANYNIGEAYEKQKDNDKAIQHYLAATRFKPDYVKAYYNLGRVYVKLNRPDEAIEQLKAAVRLSPKNSTYHNTLGVLYGQKELYADAIEHFREAVLLSPENVSYRQNLERAEKLGSSARGKN